MINFSPKLLLADVLPSGYAVNNSSAFIASNLLINFIINAFVLGVAYAIIRKAFLFKSLKFIKYILLVTIGGF